MKNWPKWACEHAKITKTGLSDGYGGETFLMMVRIGYDHHGYDDYVGNTGRERPDELFLLIWPLDSAACWSARSCTKRRDPGSRRRPGASRLGLLRLPLATPPLRGRRLHRRETQRCAQAAGPIDP